MNIHEIRDIDPFVRAVKVKKSSQLEGDWQDIDHLLIYIARGTCDYHYGEGKVCRMKAGDCIIFPPFMRHSLKKETNHSIVQYIIHFDWYQTPERTVVAHQPMAAFDPVPALPDKEVQMGNDALLVSLPTEAKARMERLFLDMFAEFNSREEGYPLVLKALLDQVLTLVFRTAEHSPRTLMPAEAEDKLSSWQIVKKVMEYIYMHYSEDLDNNCLAALVKLSPNYLSKLFQKHTGMTVHSYLIRYRLEKAREFILSGEYNITEAAIQCGFSGIYSFSKAFKQQWGMSPSEYLKTMAEGDKTISRDDYDPSKHIYYNK